ncbi:helix-turn-helix domain-containing protein [Pseudoalteromonas fenneropenaei]|uniref:Helix-turn-helix domain-containing protein n=1 Tax=Pseudoalteromonas fenneropenaei TaxID=1737459 RepID=A0ABV7CP25_9GAMM
MQTPEEYEITERVAALIKSLKKQRGYTKRDISEKLGIGLTTLDDYLNGVSSFKLGTLLKFAQLCKVELGDILDNTEKVRKLYVDSKKDDKSLGKNIGDLFMFVMFVQVMLSPPTLNLIFLLVTLFLLFYARRDFSSFFLVVNFFFIYLFAYVEFGFLYRLFKSGYSGFMQNLIMFSFHISNDVLLILLLKNRMAISLYLTKGKVASVLDGNHIDGPLYGLLLCFLFIDVSAFIENMIRNLERVGINESFAMQFWEWTFFYDYFEYMKVTIMFLIILALYIGIVIRKPTAKPALTV